MRLGVMCSGNGTNFENIVNTCTDHEVVLMVHNKKNCGAVERAERLGIPHVRLKTKQDDERIELFNAWRVDYIILAGYMRILSPKFINAFPNRIINIHPSLLPKYKGLNAIGQAFESGDRNTGCTVHYVTEELDSGTIIEQSIVPICPDDTLDTLTHRVQQAEHRLLPLVINSL
tara:strand:- start:47 stop:568 length:522 start_codon:yes stop_codon:yes gene_type:complete